MVEYRNDLVDPIESRVRHERREPAGEVGVRILRVSHDHGLQVGGQRPEAVKSRTIS